MAIAKVTTTNFKERVLKSQLPVVVDFYADWCGPCHQIAPILDTLANEHADGVLFAKVNVDEEPELARAYRISTIPAVIRFDSGAPTAWSVGPKPGYVLERELRLPRASRKSRKTNGEVGEGEGVQEHGIMAAVRSWWGSQ